MSTVVNKKCWTYMFWEGIFSKFWSVGMVRWRWNRNVRKIFIFILTLRNLKFHLHFHLKIFRRNLKKNLTDTQRFQKFQNLFFCLNVKKIFSSDKKSTWHQFFNSLTTCFFQDSNWRKLSKTSSVNIAFPFLGLLKKIQIQFFLNDFFPFFFIQQEFHFFRVSSHVFFIFKSWPKCILPNSITTLHSNSHWLSMNFPSSESRKGTRNLTSRLANIHIG